MIALYQYAIEQEFKRMDLAVQDSVEGNKNYAEILALHQWHGARIALRTVLASMRTTSDVDKDEQDTVEEALERFMTRLPND